VTSVRIGRTSWNAVQTHRAQYFEPWLIPVYKKILDLLQPKENHVLLDAGCGSGLFSVLAIARGAQLIGTEADPGLLEIAKRRNPVNHFLSEGTDMLPFAGNSFHMIVLLHVFEQPDKIEASIREAARVLRPGGRLAISVWYDPVNPKSKDILRLGRENISFIGSVPFSQFEPDVVEKLLKKSGLSLNYTTPVECPFLYSGLSDTIKGLLRIDIASKTSPGNKEQMILKKMEKVFEPFRTVDGFYFLQKRMIIYIASKQLVNNDLGLKISNGEFTMW
jgi:SAM-dependent methyltransferase